MNHGERMTSIMILNSKLVTITDTKFTVTDTKLFVPVVTLSTQDNAKLLEKLIKGFKRTINWSKY